MVFQSFHVEKLTDEQIAGEFEVTFVIILKFGFNIGIKHRFQNVSSIKYVS